MPIGKERKNDNAFKHPKTVIPIKNKSDRVNRKKQLQNK